MVQFLLGLFWFALWIASFGAFLVGLEKQRGGLAFTAFIMMGIASWIAVPLLSDAIR